MESSGNLLLLSISQQYYLRLFAVAMTVLINAQWYRIHSQGTNSNDRDIYLLLIPLLIYGLYFDYLYEYSQIIFFLIFILFIYIAFF